MFGKAFWTTVTAVLVGLVVGFLVKEMFPGLARQASAILPTIVE